jgi:hypothetical protein
MIVDEIGGRWFVLNVVAGPFVTNESAWRWLDRHEGEPSSSMLRRSSLVTSGVRDRTAADLNQIKLIINTEMQMALSRMCRRSML